MSTTHGQPGLSSERRSTIRSTILSTRHTLEDELRRQLEKYGIYEDKRLSLEDLSHLSAKERHTRRTLDAAIERELESTEGDLERSITNYVREATKTYLNRFVALKTIEVRGLVEETITERPEYGNRSYLHHTVAEIAGELTNSPDDGFGAALDLAYQEIGAEIRMIFEESEHTAIDLDAQVREEVLDKLDAIGDEAWESDEALGWVYQYFGEEEREEIDDRVDEENYKIAGTDIATKTQLFTPRYIVEWMVDNSLGRMWLEMKGERTNIDSEENCFYLAPLEDSLINRETKPVEEITILDPACGSGHMLFYAFDLLYQMYLEEGEIPREYIPREILQNNLYGIDIDSGAAQIAALSLYLKAKEKSPDVAIPQLNIVSADAVLINGDRKQDILERARSDVEEEILEQIWRSFDNIREFGSLVRVEERIDEILEDQREAIQESGQVEFTDDGSFATQSSFVSNGNEESWGQVKDRLLEEVGDLASEALERDDPIEEMFAGEVGKTVELLDLLIRQYDVAISNPPYLGSKKMGEEIKEYTRDTFVGYKDLYGCFIERCCELVRNDGYATLVTAEDFLSIYSFRKFRNYLIENQQLIEAAHLSGFSFSKEDRPFTIPFLLKRTTPNGSTNSRFLRLTHEQSEYDSHPKTIQGLSQVVSKLRASQSHEDAYIVNQKTFKNINRQPFIYWFGDELLSLFDEFPTLDETANARSGVVTGDNDYHLRKIWEVPPDFQSLDYEYWVDNGRDVDYFDYIDTVVPWKNGGQNIVQYADENNKNIQGFSDVSKYFEPGVVYRDFSSNFTAKRLPENSIHSKNAYYIEIDEELDNYLLGHLNSWLNRFIMMGLNPGLHFNPGDVKNIPFVPDPGSTEDIDNLVNFCIEERKEQFLLEDRSAGFDPQTFIKNYSDQSYYEDIRIANVALANDIISNKIFDIYDISREVRQRIREDLSADLTELSYIDQGCNNIPTILEQYVTSIEDREKLERCRTHIKENPDDDLIDTAQSLEVLPHTIAEIKYEENIQSEDRKRKNAGRITSALLGYAFGKFSQKEKNDSEIIDISNKGNSGWSRLHNVAESFLGDFDQVQAEIERLAERGLFDWLTNRYFRYNHCKEYSRRGQCNPIYWLLESPNGAFRCYIYFHDIDTNTLPKLRGQYLDSRIDELENELETLNAQTSGDDPNKDLLKRKEEVRNDLDDIKEFRNTIDEMIDDGVTVDVEKGIWENIKEWDQYEVLETGLPKLKSSYSR